MSSDWCFIPDYLKENFEHFVKAYDKGIEVEHYKGWIDEMYHNAKNILAEAAECEDFDDDDDDDEEYDDYDDDDC